jgi:hypothetical protein
VIALACATGIAPAAWAAEGSRSIDTAIDLLIKRNKAADPDPDDGPEYSG